MDLPRLRDFITRYFNDTELRDLCFDLGVEYENLGGDNKAAKARELVAYCQRHGSITQLEETCRRLRPTTAPETGRESTPPTAPSNINRSGGIDIHANVVNITGDMLGRDKKSSSDSDSEQSSAPT